MLEQWASVDEASDFQGQQIVESMFLQRDLLTDPALKIEEFDLSQVLTC